VDSHFNIAIIVLVVLAQLGGALVKAWKKRQAGDEAAKRQGGLVVVDRDPDSEATDTWGDVDQEAAPEPVRQERPTSKPPEAVAPGPDTFWEDHKAKEAEPATGASAAVPARAPEPALTPTRAYVPAQVPGVVDLPGRARIVGRAPAASRLRRMVNRDTLRQGLIAQVVLERPAITRRLKP